MFVSLRAMLPCSFVIKPFKVAISNDICKSVITYANWLLHNFKQDGKFSLQASVCKYQYESSSQTESKKGYLLVFAFCIVTINRGQCHRRLLGLSPLLSLNSSLHSNLY